MTRHFNALTTLISALTLATLTAADGPSQSTFSGRWQCTVHGSEALTNQFSFTVNDDGTVSLAGLAEEPRAAMTPSSIQFESRGGGTVDSTSLRGNGSRMDGTRTLTTPAMGVVPATNTIHRISCVSSEPRRPPTTTRADAPRSTSESGQRPSADQQVLIQDMVSTIQKLGGDSAALRVFKSDVASGQISMSQLEMMINTLIQNERDPDIRRTLQTIRLTLGSTASQPSSVRQPSASPSPVGRSDSADGCSGFSARTSLSRAQSEVTVGGRHLWLKLPAAGGQFTVFVDSPSTCNWTAALPEVHSSNGQIFATFALPPGGGSGQFPIMVQPNGGDYAREILFGFNGAFTIQLLQCGRLSDTPVSAPGVNYNGCTVGSR